MAESAQKGESHLQTGVNFCSFFKPPEEIATLSCTGTRERKPCQHTDKINPATLGVLRLHIHTDAHFFHLLQVSLCLFLLGRGKWITHVKEATDECKADISHLDLRYLEIFMISSRWIFSIIQLNPSSAQYEMPFLITIFQAFI